MKIIYVANHHNPVLDDTEGHITRGFREAGHEVVELNESGGYKATEGGLLLFHHWDAPQRLNTIKNFKGKKAFWYFDKIWYGRDRLVKDNLEVVDYAFLNDGMWAKLNPNPKIRVIRQAIGDKLIEQGLGKKTGRFTGKIAFTGSAYMEREPWVDSLKTRYSSFRHFTNVYNRDLYDLCADMNIMLAPQFPTDDHYWGNRAYLMTGSGGFLLHPRCSELGPSFKDEEEIVYYDSFEDMCEKIDYYLAHDAERENIRLAGFNRARRDHTFSKRVEQLLSML